MANELQYRDNAAAVVIDEYGRILTGMKHGAWQLPQGGVDPGESFREAIERELAEEIGTDAFTILRASSELHIYRWPQEGTGKKKGYHGQRQRYFLVQFTGDETDIDPHLHGEFSDVRWMTPQEVLTEAWAIKRPIYQKVLQEFGLLEA